MRRVGLVAVSCLLVLSSVGVTPAAAGPEAGSSDWVTVSAGGGHACGIRTTGRLYCWGNDANGQLGNGPVTGQQETPSAVTGGFTDWTSVAAGAFHTCARRANGRLYCWGSDFFGELGDDVPSADRANPRQVAGLRTDWASVSSGWSHTCARRTTGRLFCWGANGNGATGDVGPNPPIPREVAGLRTDWVSVDAGSFHTCGRRANGRLFCWGRDDRGQLGDGGTDTNQFTPVQVTGGHTDWRAVSGGETHTCGRRASGRLYCWGSDDDGELGDGGASTSSGVPVEVAFGLTDWRQVTVGSGFSCARRTTGSIHCWGDDAAGQVGNGAPFGDAADPQGVYGGSDDWRQVDAGLSFTCARIVSGRLYCWGADTFAQLGNGPGGAPEPAPDQVSA